MEMNGRCEFGEAFHGKDKSCTNIPIDKVHVPHYLRGILLGKGHENRASEAGLED